MTQTDRDTPVTALREAWRQLGSMLYEAKVGERSIVDVLLRFVELDATISTSEADDLETLAKEIAKDWNGRPSPVAVRAALEEAIRWPGGGTLHHAQARWREIANAYDAAAPTTEAPPKDAER